MNRQTNNPIYLILFMLQLLYLYVFHSPSNQIRFMALSCYVKPICNISVCLFFILFPATVFSQPLNRFQESKYLKENAVKQNRSLAQLLSFIGLQQEALQAGSADGDINYPSAIDSITIPMKVADAYSRVFDAIRKNQVVILNESHDMPITRAFLYNALDSLKALGIQHIFFEGYFVDTMYEKYGYPSTQSGTYTQEPTFSAILRKMKKLAIKPEQYEEDYAAFDSIDRNNNNVILKDNHRNNTVAIDSEMYIAFTSNDYTHRELLQALNIYQKIKENPNEKYVVFCGYAHGFNFNKLMGYFVARLLGYRPVVAYESKLIERSERKYESPIYTKYAPKAKKPFVLLDSVGNLFPFTQNNKNRRFDFAIGFPYTKYIHQRPDWLTLNGDRKRYNLYKYIPIKYDDNSFLVLVYYKNEYELLRENAVPADAIEVNKKGRYDIVLAPNNTYIVKVVKDANVIFEKEVLIK